MSNQQLPGASNALTFGIISIVAALFCCGPFGAIFSFIGLSNAKKAERAYEADPEIYASGLDNVKTGKILAYIGIGLSLIMLILCILYFGFIIAMISSGNFDGADF
ncbi:MAG: CCC motif membrane protein [Maribacter sp.]|uniref:CCC motif membrane protein n=1 Tax=Maribacter sp. TaxID=1897614 RepID=UPI003297AA8C